MENTSKSEKGMGAENPQGAPMRGLGMWILLLVFIVIMAKFFMQDHERQGEIPYHPDFVQYVKQGKVRMCEIVIEKASGTEYVQGELVQLDEASSKHKKFKTYARASDELEKLLKAHNVKYNVRYQNPYLVQFLYSVIPILLILGLLYFLFARQMRIAGKGAMSFGKSRARMLTRDKNKITFENVAGIDEAKEEIHEIIEFLKDPKRFQKLGGRIPKGVLLVGPPGTGKTLLAKAIAGEAEVPFFSISGSDFVEMFVGVGASRVRDMFDQGKKNAPCIIFIDEIDAVGRSRFSGIGGGHDEREQTLNALLVEMDGFDTREGVIIIAATNRPDVLDQALLRPGRFDRQIVIDLPTLEGRETILKIHAKNVTVSPHVDWRRIGRGTPGFSGADLANLINEAALLAARRDAEAIEEPDLEEARDKVRWGRERRSRLMDDSEKKLTAYHEAGHALVMQLLEDSEPLHKVTIIPRGQSLGSTMQLPEKDRYTESRRKLLAMMVGLMGGRAAEELVMGDITTGAYSDLKQATSLARSMVCEWGMSSVMGPQTFEQHQKPIFLGRGVPHAAEYSDETAQKIDQEVTRLVTEAYDKAMTILKENRSLLDILANLLLEQETVDGREVEDLVKYGRVRTEAEKIPKIEQEKSGEEEIKEAVNRERASEPATPPLNQAEPGASVA